MGEELNNYLLVIDTKKAHDEIEDVEQKRKDTEKKVQTTINNSERELRRTFMKAVSIMQTTWHTTETLLRVAGVSMSRVMTSAISGTFATAKILIPLFTAMELNPATMIQAGLGLTQVFLGIGAAIAAQREQERLESEYSRINSVLGAINGFIGSVSY